MSCQNDLNVDVSKPSNKRWILDNHILKIKKLFVFIFVPRERSFLIGRFALKTVDKSAGEKIWKK